VELVLQALIDTEATSDQSLARAPPARQQRLRWTIVKWPVNVVTVRSDIWAWWPNGETIRISAGNGAYMQACIHPAGGQVVFWGGPPEAQPRLWLSPTDWSEPMALTPSDSGARHASFGRGGQRIVFSSNAASAGERGTMRDESPAGIPPSGHWNLFTMAADGTDVRQVTEGPWLDQRPTLSPDGSSIAFVSDRGLGIWLVPANGSDEPRPLDEGRLLYRPAWSLDGTLLYAFCLTAVRRQVGTVSLETGAFTPFENDDRGNTHGPWPDPRGDRLIVHCDRDGGWGLWEVPFDGSPMQRLRPPGHEHEICAHGTRAENGVLTFDQAAMTELRR
jgi:WD40-like Beta Propeller Repeat